MRNDESAHPQSLLIQVFFQCLFAMVVYRFVVKYRGTASSYLVGYGLVIPTCLWLPYRLVDLLDVRNKAIKFGFGTLGTVVTFRTIEAVHGTSADRDIVESSLSNYVAYYSSLIQFDWDKNTKSRRRITVTELWTTARRIFVHYHFVSLLLSFEMQHDFRPFKSSKVQLDAFHFNLWDLLSPSHLANCYCLGLLTFYLLSTAFEITAFGENVKGLATLPIFFNPLFTSTCPSEFWGKKWNLVIHRTLKHGAYLPVRQFFSDCGNGKFLAILATFLASGLLHDYCWSVIFHSPRDGGGNDGDDSGWSPLPLKPTAFFLWNGMVLLLERPLGKYFRPVADNLPLPVVSTLVLFTALPVSHWFTGDWAMGGMLKDFAPGCWYMRTVPRTS